MNFVEKLKGIFAKKNSKNLTNVLIIGIIGLIFLFAGNIFSINNTTHRTSKPPQIQEKQSKKVDYATRMSKELEQTISYIQGVGKVRVQLFVTEGNDYEYEYNKDQVNKITNETDQNGGTRKVDENDLKKELVIVKDSNGNERPVIKSENKPVIKSVIIVAQGAENSQIKYEIFRAVSSFLNLPAHKINVLPYKRR